MDNMKQSEILSALQEKGFEGVAFYDTSMDYWYYDARLNGSKVEVRVSSKAIEWRPLGATCLESIEWYYVGTVEEEAEVAVSEEEVTTF